jgi:hypothetical protein
MKLIQDAEAVCKRLGRALHLDMPGRALEARTGAGATSDPEWVIVYRTAQGFCCMHHGNAVEFGEMLDVQLWSEEMEVETYFIGL